MVLHMARSVQVMRVRVMLVRVQVPGAGGVGVMGHMLLLLLVRVVRGGSALRMVAPQVLLQHGQPVRPALLPLLLRRNMRAVGIGVRRLRMAMLVMLAVLLVLLRLRRGRGRGRGLAVLLLVVLLARVPRLLVVLLPLLLPLLRRLSRRRRQGRRLPMLLLLLLLHRRLDLLLLCLLSRVCSHAPRTCRVLLLRQGHGTGAGRLHGGSLSMRCLDLSHQCIDLGRQGIRRVRHQGTANEPVDRASASQHPFGVLPYLRLQSLLL